MNNEFTRDIVSLIRLKHQLIRNLYIPATQSILVSKVQEITNKYNDVMSDYNTIVVDRLVYLVNKQKEYDEWLELSFLLSGLFDSYFKYAEEVLGATSDLLYVKHSIKSFVETFSVIDDEELDDPALKSLVKSVAEDIASSYSNNLGEDSRTLLNNYDDFLACVKALNLYHSFNSRRFVISQNLLFIDSEGVAERC